MKRHLVWLVLGAVACGSSSNSTAPTGNTNNNPGNPMMPSPATVSVSITGYAFQPSAVTIKAGEAVQWTNNDVVAHTSTADGGAWNSGQLSTGAPDGYGGMTSGATYSHTFTAAGTFGYHCANHSYMTGTITVTP